ncbi:ABC transporter permease [Alkalimonas mucilaginosa]|uniref:ABC transporter permease n=1 Tax=Alkalimonas mucilaginosa TaxID=3057676 RepID=A0ABU7JFD7_9GAMM|nr:FtsX-like permease family protein [Alkalimonas sp. MEB004]MEE2024401.1 ABC transporter permease [Alkalimonas sp. MEB004]
MMLYWQRFSFGLHRLLLQPKFSLPVVVSLGLTLAAVLTVLTLCNRILWQPLPGIAQADELSVHQLSFSVGGMQLNLIDAASFAVYQEALAPYGDSGFLLQSTTRLTDQADSKASLSEFTASSGFTELLGLPLLLGNSTKQASTQDVWISESFWHSQFQRRPDIVGQPLQLASGDYLIRGVLQDFYATPFKDPALSEQVWHFFQPAETMAAQGSFSMGSSGVAILRQHQEALPTKNDILHWLEQLKEQQPTVAMLAQHFDFVPEATDYRQYLLRDSQRLLVLLLLVTLALLAMATLNLANLLLGHYQGRQHEFAVQSFCGSSRNKLRLLVACENLPLVLAAMLLGMLGCLWLLQWLPELAGSSLPLVQSIGLDVTSLLLLCLLSLLLLAIFSWPVGSTALLSEQLQSSGKGRAQQQKPWLQHSLLLAQLILSGCMVFVAGMIAVTAYQDLYHNWGFDPGNSVQVRLEQPLVSTYTDDEDGLVRQHYTNWQQQLAELWPEAQVLAGAAPITNMLSVTKVQHPEQELAIDAISMAVDPAYFASFQTPILYGRSFQSDDPIESVILEHRLALLLSPDQPEQLLGQSIQMLGERHYQIIGIAGNSKNFLMAIPSLYLPATGALNQAKDSIVGQFTLLFPAGQQLLEADISSAIQSLDASYQADVMLVHSLWQLITAEQRMHLALIAVLAGISLLLALLGIAGVSRQNSQQRRYELAIRLATGASQQQVLWFLARLPLALIGLGLGTAALLCSVLYQQLALQLPGLPDFSSSNLLLLNALLLLAALPALLLPGWQVIRRDPMQSLRSL